VKRLATLTFCCLLCLAAADGAREARREISGLYKTLTRAFEHHDMKPFESLLAPDYEGIDPKGEKLSRQQILGDFKRQMDAMKDIHWIRKIKKFSFEGQEADVLVDGKMRGIVSGKDGKPHKMTLHATTLDHWLHSSSGWHIVSGHVKSFDLRIDGKKASSG
jgi:hypothetical protein